MLLRRLRRIEDTPTVSLLQVVLLVLLSDGCPEYSCTIVKIPMLLLTAE
jgi:hypothetical protein